MGTKDASPVTPLLVFASSLVLPTDVEEGNDYMTQRLRGSIADQPREQALANRPRATISKGGPAASELTKITTALAPQKPSRVVQASTLLLAIVGIRYSYLQDPASETQKTSKLCRYVDVRFNFFLFHANNQRNNKPPNTSGQAPVGQRPGTNQHPHLLTLFPA